MTCPSCQAAIQQSVHLLLLQDTLDTLDSGLGGPWYCDSLAQDPQVKRSKLAVVAVLSPGARGLLHFCVPGHPAGPAYHSWGPAARHLAPGNSL